MGDAVPDIVLEVLYSDKLVRVSGRVSGRVRDAAPDKPAEARNVDPTTGQRLQ